MFNQQLNCNGSDSLAHFILQRKPNWPAQKLLTGPYAGHESDIVDLEARKPQADALDIKTGFHAVLKVLKNYLIVKSVFKTLKKY